ncbi:von Willebrand factor A domain-containing protein 7-like [Danio aesculapii]|uniref:von Willebrand factor A domain-containing protein 7-like n=1 Tax=Danio aesculapii TaxID=1142201 RepID=UPI0024BFCAA5|nr:von Willebrand factor A domain-containing protein 7-like [Danio aesculapii]
MSRAFLLLALLIGAHSFDIKQKPNSKNHQDITSMAILRATANICKSADESFETPKQLNPKTLALACKKDAFTSNFEEGIKMIISHNVNTDLKYLLVAKYHFHSESFLDGKNLIIKGMEKITELLNQQKFEEARKTLGEIMHTLQDFYSHSNWIELGYTEPCTALINLEENIPNPADENTDTCDNTVPDTNTGAKLLDTVLQNKILTSGYFGKSKKPGKCSHGGKSDFTTGFRKSWNGINKDAIDSSHGLLHNQAAEVAIAATVQLLEKIWKSNNDANYFRLVGLHQDKPKGGWKSRFSIFSSKSRVSDASEQRNENADV